MISEHDQKSLEKFAKQEEPVKDKVIFDRW